MEAKKFWCHYVGSDGNTPKRRNIELTPIGELVPALDGVGTTPLWFEREEEDYYSSHYVYYWLYAQLSDKVALCRRCSIDIHLRTVHNLQQVIVNINGKEGTCQYYRTRGKRRPQLDGCYETAGKLYHHLQEHYDELVNYMKACNKAA